MNRWLSIILWLIGAVVGLGLLERFVLFPVLMPNAPHTHGLILRHLSSQPLPARGSTIAFTDPLNPHARFLRNLCLGECLALPGDTLRLFMPPVSSPQSPSQWVSLRVPQKGDTVRVTADNQYLLANALQMFEGVNVCLCNDGQLSIDGREGNSIVVTRDYIWLRSRSPHTAYDSRTFGLLPAQNVVGKLWLSFR